MEDLSDRGRFGSTLSRPKLASAGRQSAPILFFVTLPSPSVESSDGDDLGLGRLTKGGEPREVWKGEASVFTPWLARNIDLLADALRMDLIVTGQEVPAGGFRADIVAENAQGGVVVIENQLERTNHSHLGQCLIYAAALDATTVVWVSPEFHNEARAAFDWLNRRTDPDVAFFAVQVSLVRIGASRPAPVFDVVSRPNEVVKAPAPPSTDNRPRDFIAEVLDLFNRRHPEVHISPPRTNRSYAGFGRGAFGRWTIVTGRRGGALRVEIYLNKRDRAQNKAVYDRMAAERPRWNAVVGIPLSWERLDNRDASRIAARYSGTLDLDDQASWAKARDWAADALERMYSGLDAALRAHGEVVRAELPTAGGDDDDEDDEEGLDDFGDAAIS